VPSASHMHSNFRDKQFHLCLEQVQALDSCGFTIRNTFIHSGASYLKDASASQRAHSVPPPSRQGIDLLEISWSPNGDWWSPMLSHQEPQRTHAPLVTDSRDSLGSPGVESCASTTCSENDDLTACNSLRIDASLWERQLTCNSTSTSKLAEFVMSECQFLRIQEYCVLPETSRKAMRRKSKWMLRFYSMEFHARSVQNGCSHFLQLLQQYYVAVVASLGFTVVSFLPPSRMMWRLSTLTLQRHDVDREDFKVKSCSAVRDSDAFSISKPAFEMG